MTSLARLLIIPLMLLVCNNTYAQEFQGEATYKSHRKVDLKMGEDEMSSDMKKSIAEQLKQQFQQTYTLKFTKNESFYKKEEKLSKPNPMAGGIKIEISDGTDLLYKNIKENRYAIETEIYGKAFLIKDTIENLKWELGSETKNIGEYTCYKATYKDSITTRTINSEGGFETIKKEQVTIAWYTPQIPTANGPSNFGGLPGLILEINDGDLTLICSKIVMNPKERFTIKEPKKGKEVSQKEFDEIQEKKSEEMMERFRSNRSKDGNSKTFIISSGG